MVRLALSIASGLAHLHMEIVGTQGERSSYRSFAFTCIRGLHCCWQKCLAVSRAFYMLLQWKKCS